MKQEELTDIITDQTERALWEVKNVIDCVPDEYWDKEYCGMPVWKHIYHMLHSLDLWFINPRDRDFKEPSIHVENLNNLDVVSDKHLKREEIACIISRHTGAECVPEEDGFLLTYNRGKGCDCSIVRAGYVHSPVFCNCTLGFHQKVWSTIFERPVRVELVETFLRGGNCCSQKVFIPSGNEPNG